METETSPPLARIVLTSAPAAVSEEIGEVPPQDGVQLPESRMKASWNAFWPVASMTAATSGGLLSSGMTYGAEAYQLFPSAAVAGWPVTASAVRASTAAAAEPTAAVFQLRMRCADMTLEPPGGSANRRKRTMGMVFETVGCD